MPLKKIIRCPTCGAPNTWTPENTDKPFCSARCKLIDLGAWADEKHAIPGPTVSGDAPDKDENNSQN